MLVPRFRIRNVPDGEYRWIAESKYRHGNRYRVFTAIGRTLTDVKRFVEVVRWCERTGKIEDLSRKLVPLEEETGVETTWGGDF